MSTETDEQRIARIENELSAIAVVDFGVTEEDWLWYQAQLHSAQEDSARLDWIEANAPKLNRVPESEQSGGTFCGRHIYKDLREAVDAVRDEKKGKFAL